MIIWSTSNVRLLRNDLAANTDRLTDGVSQFGWCGIDHLPMHFVCISSVIPDALVDLRYINT